MAASIDRRTLLRGAGLAAGVGMTGLGLASCAGAGTNQPGGGGESVAIDTGNTENPFSMAADQPGEIAIPDQGWGTQWLEDQIAAFNKVHPDVEVTWTGHKDMSVTIQPRFIQGNPPDLVMPVGVQMTTLVDQGQVSNLNEFYDAPTVDGEGTVADALLPGTLEAADFLGDGNRLIGPYTFTTYGLWYQATVFEENGWTYPTTWDEMLTLCEEIKSTGLAPWAYTGKYPGYIFTPMQNMAAKASGIDWILSVDNLEPNAWRDDNFRLAAEAIAELRGKGMFLKGTEGLSHTESQTLWAQGEAAFIPCGGWLENESEAAIDPASRIRMAPTPSLTSSDTMPFETLAAYPGNQVFVPSAAKNKAFGMEFLRFMWSKECSAIWTENTKSFTSLAGYYDGLSDVPSGLESQIEAIQNAGSNILPPTKYGSFYPDFGKTVTDKTGLLASGEITPAQYIDQVQAEADKVAKDPNVKKFTRELS